MTMMERIMRTSGSGPVASRTGRTVKLMIRRKIRMKFADSRVVREVPA